MKLELKTMYFSTFINIVISILKISGGIMLHTFTLTIDGIYTVSDLVTDVIAVFGIRIGRRRANKNHPLGYGRVFYIIELFMGILAFLVGIFVIYLSFRIDYQKPLLSIILLILFTVFLKFISVHKLAKMGHSLNSELLLVSSVESKMEAYSSIALILIVLLSQIIPKIDTIGGIFIAILLIIQALKMIKLNINLLIGITDEDKSIKEAIKQIVDKYRVIHITDSSIIKVGPYYQVTLTFKAKKDMKVHSLIRIQNKIKKELKAKTLGLKFISFYFE